VWAPGLVWPSGPEWARGEAGVRRPVTHEGIRANTPGEGNRPGGG